MLRYLRGFQYVVIFANTLLHGMNISKCTCRCIRVHVDVNSGTHILHAINANPIKFIQFLLY